MSHSEPCGVSVSPRTCPPRLHHQQGCDAKSGGPGPGSAGEVWTVGRRAQGWHPRWLWRPNPSPAPWTPCTGPDRPPSEPPPEPPGPPPTALPQPCQSLRAQLTTSASGRPPQGHRTQWSSGTGRAGLCPLWPLSTCLLACVGAMPPWRVCCSRESSELGGWEGAGASGGRGRGWSSREASPPEPPLFQCSLSVTWSPRNPLHRCDPGRLLFPECCFMAAQVPWPAPSPSSQRCCLRPFAHTVCPASTPASGVLLQDPGSLPSCSQLLFTLEGLCSKLLSYPSIQNTLRQLLVSPTCAPAPWASQYPWGQTQGQVHSRCSTHACWADTGPSKSWAPSCAAVMLPWTVRKERGLQAPGEVTLKGAAHCSTPPSEGWRISVAASYTSEPQTHSLALGLEPRL